MAKQSDKEGYREGKRTGYLQGYRQGVRDAIRVTQSILEHNGLFLKESEFFLEMDTLIQEGELTANDRES